MKKPEKKAADMTVKELASYIDYSVLKPEFTEEEIIDLTKDGVKLGCATICINPGYMELCEPYVKGSETMLCPCLLYTSVIYSMANEKFVVKGSE